MLTTPRQVKRGIRGPAMVVGLAKPEQQTKKTQTKTKTKKTKEEEEDVHCVLHSLRYQRSRCTRSPGSLSVAVSFYRGPRTCIRSFQLRARWAVWMQPTGVLSIKGSLSLQWRTWTYRMCNRASMEHYLLRFSIILYGRSGRDAADFPGRSFPASEGVALFFCWSRYVCTWSVLFVDIFRASAREQHLL